MTVLKHITAWMTALVMMLALVGFAMMFIPQYQKHSANEQRLEELRRDREREENRLQDLRVRQQRFQTERSYVRKVAHEIGMVEPHEVIFRFYDDENHGRRRNRD